MASRWPGLWTDAPPTTLPSGYRRDPSQPDVEVEDVDDDPAESDRPAPRPTRTRSHVKVRRGSDTSDGGATVTPLLPSLRERSTAAASDVDSSLDPDLADYPTGGPGVVARIAGPFQTVVTAVYAALADPLVNAPVEVREKRAAQVRRVGIAAAGTLLACILVYAIFPVQTYLDMRSATQRAEEQREALQRANDELEQRQRQLNEDGTVEEIAREDYGMVLPGEESYGVLPAPESTTTSTTPPPG